MTSAQCEMSAQIFSECSSECRKSESECALMMHLAENSLPFSSSSSALATALACVSPYESCMPILPLHLPSSWLHHSLRQIICSTLLTSALAARESGNISVHSRSVPKLGLCQGGACRAGDEDECRSLMTNPNEPPYSLDRESLFLVVIPICIQVACARASSGAASRVNPYEVWVFEWSA